MAILLIFLILVILATFAEVILEIKDEQYAAKMKNAKKAKEEFLEISGVVNESYMPTKEFSNSETNLRKRNSAKEKTNESQPHNESRVVTKPVYSYFLLVF